MEAKELESLSMLSRGFIELKEANPELAYNLVLDILSGINEYVFSIFAFHILIQPSFSNQAVRQHISTTRGLFPHRRIQRNTLLTPKGVVVVEQEDPDDIPPASPVSPPVSPSRTRGSSSSNLSTGSSGRDDGKKSPISELLYMRWLDGLKLKWPSLL
jgi:serine/threonine-protein kinase 24/25/MST4